jgi:hypothetical protein
MRPDSLLLAPPDGLEGAPERGVLAPPDGSEGEVAKAADGLGWYAADSA